ncbi:hypothetical protein EVG20_g9565 [Dentipellis fragilis]|uniref:T6SS Phospholipase effector Tle1-like catalytic domain-containing protein n=1 Tax=Dentipellis fragilis TaxID=205917 RepID=A0A4Y9Y1N9_9AGAM|nr:hypothetical protein EVG20_g9565 [Dentipellis fragilis]
MIGAVRCPSTRSLATSSTQNEGQLLMASSGIAGSRSLDVQRNAITEDHNQRRQADLRAKDGATRAPCGCSKLGRNLVVCIDGTSNKFGRNNTNVVELYRLLQKNREQLTYYNSGIGTYAKPSWRSLSYWRQVISHKIDLAIAWNFERILLEAYQWLAENYQEGDCIYLFGFSRGAYQVRALAAMIHKVGLIHKGNEAQIPFAYELFTALSPTERNEHAQKPGDEKASSVNTFPSRLSKVPRGAKSSRPGELPEEMAIHFRDTFSRTVSVHFVGVWDTVSSVGVVRDKVLPYTASGMQHVCFFRHALALDERRVKFCPEYANGGTTLKDGKQTKISVPPHTKEVWFGGTHSDIGGGNVNNLYLDHSGPPLRWMSYEATKVGLHMLPFRGEWSLDNMVDVHESLTWVWRPLELLPFTRLSYKRETSLTRAPHWGKGRRIQPGQFIHSSAILCKKNTYVPRAKISGSLLSRLDEWEKLKENLLNGQSNRFGIMLEGDLYDWVLYLVKQSRLHIEQPTLPRHDLVRDVSYMLTSAEGLRALLEVPDAAEALIPLFRSTSEAALAVTSNDSNHVSLLLSSNIQLLAAYVQITNEMSRNPQGRRRVSIVEEADKADLVLALAESVVELLTSKKIFHEYGLRRRRSVRTGKANQSDTFASTTSADVAFCLPLDDVVEQFPLMIDGFACFQHYLRVKAGLRAPVLDPNDVTVELYHLVPEKDRHWDSMRQVMVRDHSTGNLVNEGQVQLEATATCDAPRRAYGVTIVNNSPRDLFPYLLYFNPNDLSISILYLPTNKTAPTLRRHNSVSVGYGSDTPALLFDLPDDLSLDSGLIKLFVSAHYIDLRWIAQVMKPAVGDAERRTTKPKPVVWDTSDLLGFSPIPVTVTRETSTKA